MAHQTKEFISLFFFWYFFFSEILILLTHRLSFCLSVLLLFYSLTDFLYSRNSYSSFRFHISFAWARLLFFFFLPPFCFSSFVFFFIFSSHIRSKSLFTSFRYIYRVLRFHFSDLYFFPSYFFFRWHDFSNSRIHFLRPKINFYFGAAKLIK